MSDAQRLRKCWYPVTPCARRGAWWLVWCAVVYASSLLAQGPPIGPPAAVPPGASALPTPTPQEVEDAEIVAVVGETPILAGEILPQVREILEPSRSQMPPEEYERQKRKLLERLLKQRIQLRMLYQAFIDSLPEEKRDEILKKVYSQLDKKFYDEQVPDLLKKSKAKSAAELDQMLRRYGSSLEQQKLDFREQTVARMMVQQNVKRDEEITHEELLDYYHEHLRDYEYPARVRWERLTARFDKFPDKAAADRAIVEMGNLVLRGVPFAEVAKRYSQGSHADEGGYHDWTTKGALVSKVLDEALFSLPVGRLSQILEDEQGFHIVRVIERQPAGRRPFEEVQDEIRDKIRKERFQKNLDAYLKKVERETYIWTVFDDPDNP
ncbi:MAG TPA: hypothetical protein ENJ16_02910 [Planctomycetaceae bacterium]|nr:hypothetical protein [Planctomycetaceae bacterium]